jgi:uncharacterized membrane protein HdeD (DUF308 family)
MTKKYYSPMAIASFVLGIVSILGGVYLLLIFWFTDIITPVLAIILGIFGLDQVRRNKELKGKMLAWIGVSLALIKILLFVITFFFLPVE